MLNKNEKLLVEAIKSMLHDEAKLGLASHDKDQQQQGEVERGSAYLHEQINDMFALKAAELTHCLSVRKAFTNVHSYKYIDDPTFCRAMEKEMTVQAVPAEERKKACDYVDKIIEELKAEGDVWCEMDAGFHPKLDEIMEMPEQPTNMTIETVDGWPTEANVEWEEGDADMGRQSDN